MSRKNGFTVPEILISSALVGVMSLILVTLFIFVSGRYQETKGRLDAEYMAARAEVLLRQYFASAISISSDLAPGANIRGGILGNPNGFTYNRINDAPGNWTRVATFWREDSPQRGSTNHGGTPRATAMWYRRPARNTSGVLFIDGGNNRTSMQPAYTGAGNAYIDRISGISMIPERHPRYNQLTSIDVTLRFRYHIGHNRGFNWCPTEDINANTPAGCGGANPVPVRDIERSFRIVLQNNMLRVRTADPQQHSSGLSEERVMGNLYFFKMVNPTLWN